MTEHTRNVRERRPVRAPEYTPMVVYSRAIGRWVDDCYELPSREAAEHWAHQLLRRWPPEGYGTLVRVVERSDGQRAYVYCSYSTSCD